MLFQTYLLKISLEGKWEASQWNTHCSFIVVTPSVFFTPLLGQCFSWLEPLIEHNYSQICVIKCVSFLFILCVEAFL